VPALKVGTIDAIVIDRPVAENIIAADSDLEISGGIETEEQYGFVVQQGDEELLDELNEGLEEVIDSGEYETIYKKWFHKPVPPGIGTTTHEAT
jgi:ABC-type amino acid transport substrate-binding protein